MKKSKNDRLFSYLSLGFIIMLMFCELACGNLARHAPFILSERSAILADADGGALTNPLASSLQNGSPMGDALQNEGDTNNAWGFVLAAGIGILLIAIVVGLTAKKRKPRGK